MRILAINPGSTSTKIALFDGETKRMEKSVSHDRALTVKPVAEQMEERAAFIEQAVRDAGYTMESIDAFSGRGGGLVNCEGGVYFVTERLLEDARIGKGALHPACLGSQIADAFARRYGGQAFVVNPPDVDELAPQARLTGLRNVYRMSHIHTLNEKEVGIRYAASLDMKYEDMNLIIAHIGGGISVTAHEKGRMIDSSSNIKGDGPMAPTRAGTVPAVFLIDECFSGRYTHREMIDRIQRKGGWMEHLGTDDGREIARRIADGDAYAKLVLDATIHQIAKNIGAYATVLCGQIDAIILTGGLAHDEYLVQELSRRVSFLGRVIVYPGEFEMEALAAGALRVMTGEEQGKTYTGNPVWTPEMLDQLRR